MTSVLDGQIEMGGETADGRFFVDRSTEIMCQTEAFKLGESFWLKHHDVLPMTPSLLSQFGVNKDGEFTDIDDRGKESTITLAFDPSHHAQHEYGWFVTITKKMPSIDELGGGGRETYGLIVNRGGKLKAGRREYDVQGTGRSTRDESPAKVLELVKSTLAYASPGIEQKTASTRSNRQEVTKKLNDHIMKNGKRLYYKKTLTELENTIAAPAFSSLSFEKFIN